MNSTFKAVLIIGLVVGLVFGATLISMYTGSTESLKEGGDDVKLIDGPPLFINPISIGYDPSSSNPDLKYFPGFYEPGETLIRVWFWFKNPHKLPIRVAVLGRSCSACTSARLAVIDSPYGRRFEGHAAFAGGAAPLLAKLDWKELNFEKPEESVEVPPAASEDEPTWGLFEMAIKVRGMGPNTLTAEVGLTAGQAAQSRLTFRVTIVGVPPFNVVPLAVNLGRIPESTAPQTQTLHYWSATRELAELPPPEVSLGAKEPYIVVGTPVAMTKAECDRLMASYISDGKTAKVMSGYKVPFTSYRKLPEPVEGSASEPDIGPFTRQMSFKGPGGTALGVAITGNIVGLVSLAEGSTVDLKDFESRFGVEKTFNLVSDRTDVTLEKVKAEFRPGFLDAEVGEAKSESGRRYWAVKVIVPKGQLRDELPPDSVLVFLAKTPTATYKVRVPVKGRAFERSK